ncbi:hypothetical protein BSZ32_10695 [Rubritalea profundi]|uniref:Prepilin-type N-terminal cleavage/methylation domain-containing protein n=2 Tax=Rubritalea profundi TaxID=1658618 RepID=A0A2S7U1N4_9BACT|nr:hypothetical protein BSZ32_10695 [Rubritalea profundi]
MNAMQKTSYSQFIRRGFSLVEILVVITIIAVLAAIAYPVAGKMIKSSKLKKNLAMIVTIERGIEDFYDDYGYFPIDAGSDDEIELDQVNLLNALAGNTKDRNTTGKNFVASLPDASNGVSGLVYLANGDIDSLVNSFGGDFYIMLDGTFDEEIDEPNEFGNTTIKQKRSLIWTYGEEGQDGDENDFVTSWE